MSRCNPDQRRLSKANIQVDKSLLLASSILKLCNPSKRALEACHYGLNGEHGNTPLLDGDGRYFLKEAFDLVALKPPGSGDLLSSTLGDHWPMATGVSITLQRVAWQYILIVTQNASTGQFKSARYFEEQRLVWVVSALSTAIAAILLIGSILTLYFVTNPDARLALVISFIVLFALGLSLSTAATRDRIFAATAAYAAVLVVFVSGNLGNANASSSQ